jgi:predicted phosphodiesterase
MKLLVLSDLHLECAGLALPDHAEFDVAILAGDIVNPGSELAAWVQATPVLRRARAIVAVSGNHEYYDRVMQHETAAMHAATRALRSPPLHMLDCDQVVVDGVRFLGCTLWTDFALPIETPEGPRSDPLRGVAVASRRMADYRAIDWLGEAAAPCVTAPRKLTPYDTLRLHRAQRAWLEAALAEPFDGSTVVVTHHGPHRNSLAPRFAADWVSTAYLSELPGHFFEVPALWVHGHTHTSHDYRVGGCRVLCNPRGYPLRGRPMPENAAFDAARVVQVGIAPRAPGAAPGQRQKA